MQHCFDMTEDAMVGQQLARFNIHIKDFEAAEVTIKKSINISQIIHIYWIHNDKSVSHKWNSKLKKHVKM